MLNKRSFLAVLGAAFIATACTAPTPKAIGAGLVSKGYQITNVDIIVAKDAAVGRFKKDPALMQKAVQSIDDTLSAQLIKPRGKAKKAQMRVEITEMVLRSAGGRTLVAVENKITANVVVTDSKRQVLATQQIFFARTGARNNVNFNGIPIGLLISGAVNAGKSGSGSDLKEIVDGFNGKVQNWAAN